jgi:formylglycine-generating enzyme required for sulfatase activity
MGSSTTHQDTEEPEHNVNITRSYYIGNYEVTQKEWIAIMGSNPANTYGVGDFYPVYYISWYDILVYCNKRSLSEGFSPCYSINGSTNTTDWGIVPASNNATWNLAQCDFTADGYRMPTEAEWEYAAQYNDNRTYPWGETAPSTVLCNFDNHIGKSTVVGSYPLGKSKLGLCDLSGNITEWCWDWYALYSSTEQTDPTGPTSGDYRVWRGSGWYDTINPTSSLSCTFRDMGATSPEIRAKAHGFRLARTK